MKPGELWECVWVAWLWTPPFWEMGEPAPPPCGRTNLVLSSGLSSAGGLSLAREGPGQDNSSDPQGGGSEEEPAVCDSDPQGGTGGRCGSGRRVEGVGDWPRPALSWGQE